MGSKKHDDWKASPEWREMSRKFRNMSGNRCGVLPWLRANCSHHLTYDNLCEEKYIRDCIPLSNAVHHWIHFNPIAAYWWKDVRGRRRWMNNLFRVTTAIVTAFAFVFNLVYLIREVIAPSPGVLLQSSSYFQEQNQKQKKPKIARPKLKKRKR
jgi:hypothetical protein